jgi:ATP-dependent protease ClpP protease subunit
MEYYNKLIKEKNKSTILLYGEIGDNSEVTCSDIVGEILQADAENKPLEIRINSNGGEVYSGIAIIAAILNCENDIKIVLIEADNTNYYVFDILKCKLPYFLRQSKLSISTILI